jgi:YHS domain-containing protein
MIQNLDNGIAAQGYDVIAFFQGKAIKGNPTASVIHQGVTYHFSSTDNKNEFTKIPEKYTPQYGGFCAVAMSEEAQANPNPKSFKIEDGKLYLFTRMLFGIIDAQRQWNKKPELKGLANTAWSKMNQ